MKKFLLTVLCALFCLCGMAQSEKIYTEPLVVTINGESTEPQDASITVVDNGNGTINFVLNNFILAVGEEQMGVGNIVLNNLETKESIFGLKYFSYDGTLAIAEGNKEGIDTWMGPMLGDIPLVLQGKMTDDNLYVTIDIDMQAMLGQIIYVKLGANDLSREKIYTEPLVVTINGESTEPQNTSITVVDNGDGTINFVLNNFILAVGEEQMGVGNIVLDTLVVTKEEDGLMHINYDGPLAIAAGDKEGVDLWMGPMLGEIPLKLVGKMTEEKLYVTINIDMQAMIGQIISVQLGTDDFNSLKTGDVNADGDVTIADGVAVLNAMAGQEVPGNADVNNDGDITIADFVAVLNIMAGQ
ncbi:MAG: hypothetical protein IJJ73_02035 [Bacteroidaceae bacterium]|nr:hypothetical protein [Bacteroidaceae bacterium]